MNCTNGHAVDPRMNHCSQCGVSIHPKCSNGHPNQRSSAFCAECGVKVAGPPVAPPAGFQWRVAPKPPLQAEHLRGPNISVLAGSAIVALLCLGPFAEIKSFESFNGGFYGGPHVITIGICIALIVGSIRALAEHRVLGLRWMIAGASASVLSIVVEIAVNIHAANSAISDATGGTDVPSGVLKASLTPIPVLALVALGISALVTALILNSAKKTSA